MGCIWRHHHKIKTHSSHLLIPMSILSLGAETGQCSNGDWRESFQPHSFQTMSSFNRLTDFNEFRAKRYKWVWGIMCHFLGPFHIYIQFLGPWILLRAIYYFIYISYSICKETFCCWYNTIHFFSFFYSNYPEFLLCKVWYIHTKGTLFFVTAAHCVTIQSGIVPSSVNPKDLMVVLGKHLRDWDQKQNSEIRVEVG